MGQALAVRLPESKRGLFSRIPLRLYGVKAGGKKLTPSACYIGGKIYAFSHTNDPEAACRLNYEQVGEEFGFSRSTIAEAFGRLNEAGQIEKVSRDQDGTAYKYTQSFGGNQYDVVPQYLFTAEVKIDGKIRCLTGSEIRVLSHLMTECDRPQNGGFCSASVGKLARLLRLSRTTVRKALRALMRAGLVYRRKENKGTCRQHVSAYEVNREVYDYKKYIRKKTRGRRRKSAEAEDADARSDRQRYYAGLQAEAQSRAEKYRLKAYTAAPELKTIDRELSVSEIALAKAELSEPLTLPAIRAKRLALQERRKAKLKEIGIAEELLVPQYRCRKCSDTGYKPDGSQCDCYPEKSGRARR